MCCLRQNSFPCEAIYLLCLFCEELRILAYWLKNMLPLSVTFFCYFGSRSPVLNSKACIWAVHLNIVILFICPMRGLFIISNYHRIAQWNVLNIRVWEPVHFFRLWRTQWIQLIVVALNRHWCNFSVPLKTGYLVFKTTGLIDIKISKFGMDEIFANNHIWEVAHDLRVIIHQLASVVWSWNVL